MSTYVITSSLDSYLFYYNGKRVVAYTWSLGSYFYFIELKRQRKRSVGYAFFNISICKPSYLT